MNSKQTHSRYQEVNALLVVVTLMLRQSKSHHIIMVVGQHPAILSITLFPAAHTISLC